MLMRRNDPESENKLKRSFGQFILARLNVCIDMFIQGVEYNKKLDFLDSSSLESCSWSPSKNSIATMWTQYCLSWPGSRYSTMHFKKCREAVCDFWSLSNSNIVFHSRNRECNWLDRWDLEKVLRIETCCVSHSQLSTQWFIKLLITL